MARARNIKPGFFKNEILGVADPLYSLLFEGLWVLADREGRLEDRPLRIQGEVFPYRAGLDMEGMLDWLQDNGFISRYQVAGKRYILVLEFVKHQNPHKNETASDIPPPEEIRTKPELIGSTRADSLSSDSLIPDSLPPLPPEGDDGLAGWAAFWTAYPKKVGKIAARKAFAKLKPDSALVARMVTALGWQSQREQWTKAGGQYVPDPSTWLNKGRWEDARPTDGSNTVPMNPSALYKPAPPLTPEQLAANRENAAKQLAALKAGGLKAIGAH